MAVARMALFLSLAAGAAGCARRESPPPLLRTGAGYVCGPAPTFLVDARADGQYGLGQAVFDSAHLVDALDTACLRPQVTVYSLLVR